MCESNFDFYSVPILVSMSIVLVQTAITNHLRLGGLNNKYLFPTFLEAEKSKIKTPADHMSSESLLPDLQKSYILKWYRVEREEANSPVSSYEGTNPIRECFILKV